MMNISENQKVYQFISEQYLPVCPTMTVERVEKIHQELTNVGNVKHNGNEIGCITQVIEELRAQGLGTVG